MANEAAEPIMLASFDEVDAAAAEPVMHAVVGDDFTRSDKYKWYEQYADDKYSVIDGLKSIRMDDRQINLTKENNSQFIQFEMPRYYDGVDLMQMLIQVHYVNKNKEDGIATQVNVTYSANKIHFNWLVDKNVTNVEGEVDFEITATGSNEKSESYLWKSRPNGKLNILKSLAGNGVVKPSDDWYTGFVQLMTYTIPVQSHGSHLLEVSMTAQINGKTVTSNVIKKDVIWVMEDDMTPIISCDGNTIWITRDMYKIPVDGFDTVELIPIDTYEYQQLKELGGKTPEEIIDAYTLTLLEGGVL